MGFLGIALLAIGLLAYLYNRFEELDKVTGKQIALEFVIVAVVIALVYWAVEYA